MLVKIFVAMGASALFVAPLVAASPAAARNCPYGTVATYNGICTNGMPVGGTASASPPAAPSAPGAAGLPGTVSGNVVSPATLPSNNGLTSVDGIPCTQKTMGTCIALQQSGQ